MTRQPGVYSQTVLFDFGDFCVSRPVSGTVVYEAEGQLAPSTPYLRQARDRNRQVWNRDGAIPGKRIGS